MAAISFDSDLVQLSTGDGGTVGHGTAGESIQQGWAIVIVDGVLVPAENQSGAALAHAVGIALSLGQQNQPITYATSGIIDFGSGATLVTGRAYYVGVGGGIIPEGDLTSGNYATFLGIAQSTRLLLLAIQPSGVVRS